VDEQSEKKIIEVIHQEFPEHTIFAEESGAHTKDSDNRWIIDPLDGTKNYISGIPVFAISIALEIGGKIKVGVVYDPVRDDMFYAEMGTGAYLNQNSLHVSSETELEKSLLGTGFPFKLKHMLPNYLACFQDVFNQVSGMRRMGAAALDMAYVAAGKFEAFWEIGLSPWDMAAGLLIVREAGGTVTDFWGKADNLPNDYLIASNSLVHKKLVEIISAHFTENLPLN
jgi:myo-inositol-1(or 4)-monophosphatase